MHRQTQAFWSADTRNGREAVENRTALRPRAMAQAPRVYYYLVGTLSQTTSNPRHTALYWGILTFPLHKPNSQNNFSYFLKKYLTSPFADSTFFLIESSHFLSNGYHHFGDAYQICRFVIM